MPGLHGCSLLLVLALLTATSCSNDYLSNNTINESAWCMAQGRGNQLSLITDDKSILKLSESSDSILFLTGLRYRVFYILLGDQGYYASVPGSKLVKITDEQPVIVEDVILSSLFTGSVNDPVWRNDKPFFGGGFLNLDFQFLSSSSGILHGIHLLQDSLVNRKLYMKLGHFANGDVTGSRVSALASFPISSIQNASNADSLIILMLDDATHYNSYGLALKDTL